MNIRIYEFFREKLILVLIGFHEKKREKERARNFADHYERLVSEKNHVHLQNTKKSYIRFTFFRVRADAYRYYPQSKNFTILRNHIQYSARLSGVITCNGNKLIGLSSDTDSIIYPLNAISSIPKDSIQIKLQCSGTVN